MFAYSALASVDPREDGALADLAELDGSGRRGKGDGKGVVRVRANYVFLRNGKVGMEVFQRVMGWLRTGTLQLQVASTRCWQRR